MSHSGGVGGGGRQWGNVGGVGNDSEQKQQADLNIQNFCQKSWDVTHRTMIRNKSFKTAKLWRRCCRDLMFSRTVIKENRKKSLGFKIRPMTPYRKHKYTWKDLKLWLGMKEMVWSFTVTFWRHITCTLKHIAFSTLGRQSWSTKHRWDKWRD